MVKKSNLVSETIMYSINPGSGQVVVHHLPWSRSSPQLERYIERGFSFEKPEGSEIQSAPKQVRVEAEVVGEKADEGIPCPVCGRVCKGDFGLKSHMRSHKKGR